MSLSIAEMESSIHILFSTSADYPLLLKEISDFPRTLYYRGALPACLPCVGIVGTRKASAEARALARETARILSCQGFAIVSGLAFGVDAAAHEGALSGGTPTFAVQGSGLNETYPREHENLARQILDAGGGVLSEYEPSSPALPHQFLERNRIISGLCVSVIFIEVPIRSGAMSTARHAATQGRDILVFANRPSNHRYEGSHMLLREGARFVSSPEDALEDVLATLPRYPALKLSASLMFRGSTSKQFGDEKEEQVYNELFRVGTSLSVDNLAEITTLDVQSLNMILTNLILAGMAYEEGGRFFVRK